MAGGAMRAGLRLIVALGAGMSLAGCADTPPTTAPAGPVAAVTSDAPDATGGIVLHPTTGGDGTAPVMLVNDPSAPLDTPLCGMAAREANAIGQTLLSRQYATVGICSSYACYDPATATYIGADGYRHVCR